MSVQDRLERQMLLAESGELSPARQRALDRGLAEDSAAAAQRDAWRRLLAAAGAALPGGAPPPAVFARLHAEAAAVLRARQSSAMVRPLFLRALAYAAILFAAISLWRLHSAAQPDRIGMMDALVAVAGENADTALQAAVTADREEQLRALGARLLEIEGLAEDEFAEETEGEATAPAEPAPTTSRWRSTRAPTAKTCG
jgi:hypothetical protein